MSQLIYAIEPVIDRGLVIVVADRAQFKIDGRHPPEIMLPVGMGRRFRRIQDNRFRFNGSLKEAHAQLHEHGLRHDKRLLRAKPVADFRIFCERDSCSEGEIHTVRYGTSKSPSHSERMFADMPPSRLPAIFKDDAPAWGLISAFGHYHERREFAGFLRSNPDIQTVGDCKECLHPTIAMLSGIGVTDEIRRRAQRPVGGLWHLLALSPYVYR